MKMKEATRGGWLLLLLLFSLLFSCNAANGFFQLVLPSALWAHAHISEILWRSFDSAAFPFVLLTALFAGFEFYVSHFNIPSI